MRVLVCGGRNYDDRDRVFQELSAIHKATPISCIIEGGARGADYLASRWSAANDLHEHARFTADWALRIGWLSPALVAQLDRAMKKIDDEPQGVWDYQAAEAVSGKKIKPDKFCRSCGEPLPKRSNPIGIQLFYCQPNCAFDAAVHAAAKGYASHLYVGARNSARKEK